MGIGCIHWDNPPPDAVPIYDLSFGKKFFVLEHNRNFTRLFEVVSYFECEPPESYSYTLSWCGPYSPERANNLIKWLIEFLQNQVTPEQGLLVSWKEDPRGILIASCVCRLWVPPEHTIGHKPPWFTHDELLPKGDPNGDH
jgi:hypothetical protein